MSWLAGLRARRLPRHDLKLHLGCGAVHLDGWVNIDRAGPADLHLDIRRPLPFADGAARVIYHEHLMEHLTVEEGERCLRDWFRLLRPGGVLRIATPDLAYLVERYRGPWREQAWLTLPEYAFIKTPAEMLNVALRWWEHRYLYDGEELERRMREAGFTPVRRCQLRESPEPALRGLETRDDSKLILEGLRP